MTTIAGQLVGRVSLGPLTQDLLWGIAALFLAIPVALAIGAIHLMWAGQPEKSVMLTGLLFAALLSIPVLSYLAIRGRAANPATLGLIILTGVSIELVATYFFVAAFYIFFPADFLIWSESGFVADILKFRVGYPIYTAPVNNESFIYPPGAQLLTYFISSIFGGATSLSVYRMVQVGYTALASVFALLSVHGLIKLRYPTLEYRRLFPWGLIWLPVLFLIACNLLTNPFAHNLHNDSLALLISVAGYYLLIKYAANRDRRVLALMALIPDIGFVVKQSIAIWAVLYLVQLVFFDQPRSWSRIAAFALASFGGVILMTAGGYLIWGGDFLYWIFTANGNSEVSILRGFQHVLDSWPYWVVGLIGGLVLLRGCRSRPILGLWLIWLALFAVEAYTSGIAWMLNHLGPGSVLAGIWFIAALTSVWTTDLPRAISGASAQRWLSVGAIVAVLALLFNGMGMVRIPTSPIPEDTYRYVSDIEAQFQGLPTGSVLLDSGSWLYLKDGVVMKDRVDSIGDRGMGGLGDFSGMIDRLKRQQYSKILVRNLDHPLLWYDSALWGKSSGIRQAMLKNYQVAGVIPGVEGENQYLFSDVTILVPKVR